MAVLMWYMCVCNIYKKQKQYRGRNISMLVIIAEKPNSLVVLEDMQEYDYICAPSLMATNKITDHESDILQYCMLVSKVQFGKTT
ncbi:hypothetical protein T07_14669 [Trichinella nelsoni]|uniref:Uncharacterized protein n=1 Tax=Trichinella nelsoni TaxID=6336 RepID=A0A0V0RD47_9BILA|nr:hypothetical protein T07_14669 [Trichinella nelsoni]